MADVELGLPKQGLLYTSPPAGAFPFTTLSDPRNPLAPKTGVAKTPAAVARNGIGTKGLMDRITDVLGPGAKQAASGIGNYWKHVGAEAEDRGRQLVDALVTGAKQTAAGAKASYNAYRNDQDALASNLKDYGVASQDYEARATSDDKALAEKYGINAQQIKEAKGFWPKFAESTDYLRIATEHPFAALKQTALSVPGMFVTIPVSHLGSAAGTFVGGGLGATTGAGAVISALLGGFAGAEMANIAMEIGPATYEEL